MISTIWYILGMYHDTIFSIYKNQYCTFTFKVFLNVTHAIYVEKCTLSNGVLKNKNGLEERDLGGKSENYVKVRIPPLLLIFQKLPGKNYRWIWTIAQH